MASPHNSAAAQAVEESTAASPQLQMPPTSDQATSNKSTNEAPPPATSDTPPAATPPAATSDTPPAATSDTPPAATSDTPPAATSDTPAALPPPPEQPSLDSHSDAATPHRHRRRRRRRHAEGGTDGEDAEVPHRRSWALPWRWPSRTAAGHGDIARRSTVSGVPPASGRSLSANVGRFIKRYTVVPETERCCPGCSRLQSAATTRSQTPGSHFARSVSQVTPVSLADGQFFFGHKPRPAHETSSSHDVRVNIDDVDAGSNRSLGTGCAPCTVEPGSATTHGSSSKAEVQSLPGKLPSLDGAVPAPPCTQRAGEHGGSPTESAESTVVAVAGMDPGEYMAGRGHVHFSLVPRDAQVPAGTTTTTAAADTTAATTTAAAHDRCVSDTVLYDLDALDSRDNGGKNGPKSLTPATTAQDTNKASEVRELPTLPPLPVPIANPALARILLGDGLATDTIVDVDSVTADKDSISTHKDFPPKAEDGAEPISNPGTPELGSSLEDFLSLTVMFANDPGKLWPLWLIVRIVMLYGVLVILFGGLPLGAPNANHDFSQKAVFIFVTSPFTYLTFCFLLILLFYGALGEERPLFKTYLYWPVLLGCYVVQTTVVALFYTWTQTFRFMGIIPFIVCLVYSLIALRLFRRRTWCPSHTAHFNLIHHDFCRVVFAIAVFISLLAVWVMIFREGSRRAQFIMPVILLILVFIWKKILLNLTERFPVVIAMLISGLWIENLDDVFQTLVFPVVTEPGPVYAVLGLRKLAENIAYIFFFTERWFRFRVWIKAFLKNTFTGRFGDPTPNPIYEDEHIDDRGHSNERPGYLRRQIQFLVYKLLSQAVTYFFFLVVTPALRFGPNSLYFPLSPAGTNVEGDDLEDLDDPNYKNALAFSAAGVVMVTLSALAAWWYIHTYLPYSKLVLASMYGPVLNSNLFYGFLVAVFASGMLLALSVLQYHNRIWYYREHDWPISAGNP